jgi:MFS family permease
VTTAAKAREQIESARAIVGAKDDRRRSRTERELRLVIGDAEVGGEKRRLCFDGPSQDDDRYDEQDETVAILARVRTRVGPFIFFTVFLDLIGFGIVFPLLPFYVKTMGGSAETVGVLLSSFAFTQLVATPFLGRLSDRIGRRPVILISLAGNALSMFVFAVATRVTLLPLLFASRILAGATAGNLSACQAAIADVTTGDERAKEMGRLGAAMGLGLVLGPVVGSTLSHFGPWAPPLAAAALAMLDFVGAAILMPETRHLRPLEAEGVIAPPTPHVSLMGKLREKRVVMVLGVYFLVFLCMSNLQVALALLCNERFEWGAKEVGNVFALFGFVALIVQGLLIGRLSKIFGQINLVAWGAILMVMGMLIVAIAHSPPSLVAGLFLVAVGFGVTTPTMSSIASDVAGEETRGAVLGFAQSAGGLARTIGPVWGGVLYARVGPASPFYGAAIGAVVWFGLAFTLKRDLALTPPTLMP